MRLPNGAWMTSCMPSDWSKKRSITMQRCVGSAPSTARPAPRCSTIWRAASASRPASATSSCRAASAPSRAMRRPTCSRSRDTACDSSSLRPGASPSQNGMFGGAPCASSTRTRPALDAQDAVARIAELEHIAGQALDREVLVDAADAVALRLEQHGVVAGLGDGAARGQRGHARAAPLAQPVRDAHRGAATRRAGRCAWHSLRRACAAPRRSRRAPARHTARRGTPARTARPRPIRGTAVSATICCASTSSGCAGSAACRARRAAPHRAAPRIRPVRRIDVGNRRALGVAPTAWPERPARCSSVEIERGEPIWHTRSISPMSRPSSSDAVATSSFSSPRFRRCSAASRVSRARLPWCAATASPAEPLAEVARGALGHAARIDEDERGAVLRGELDHALPDLVPLVVRHHRRSGVGGSSSARSRGLAWPMSTIAQSAVRHRAARRRRPGSAPPRRAASASPTGRCAAAAARPATAAARARARGGCRACSAPARGSRRRSRCAPSRASRGPTGRAEQHVQRFGRRDQDVRRPAQIAAAVRRPACRRCAPRCGSPRRAGRARRVRHGCRPAAPRG